MKAITKNKRKISDEIIDNNNLTIKSNFKHSKKIPKIKIKIRSKNLIFQTKFLLPRPFKIALKKKLTKNIITLTNPYIPELKMMLIKNLLFISGEENMFVKIKVRLALPLLLIWAWVDIMFQLFLTIKELEN